MKKIVSLLLAAAMALTLLAGCNTYTDDGSSKTTAAAGTEAGAESLSGEKETEGAQTGSGDTSFTLLANGPVTLNPLLSQSSNDGDVFYLIYTLLVRMYQDEVIFDGAESVDINDDYTEFTFHLRDAQFADGTPITADMYEFTIYAMLTPDYGCPTASHFYMLEGAEAYNAGETDDWSTVGCKATDDKTLVFTLAYPYVDFVTELATDMIMPLEKDFVDEKGNNLGASIDDIRCSGPYVLTDWQLESSLTFEKNPNYWDAANSFPVQHVEAIQVSDANTKVAMYENNEADAMMVVPSEYISYLGDDVHIQPGNGINMMWLNSQGENGELMGNSNFGLALSYALDRESMMAAINPTTIPANRIVNAAFTTADGTTYQDAYPVDYVGVNGDVAKAQEYLAAALSDLGYSSVDELPTLHYVTYENTEQKLIAEAIIDQWKQNLGITVELEQYTIGTAIGMFYTGDFDMFDIGIECGVTSIYTMSQFIAGGDYDNGCWHSDAFDEIITQAKVTVDEAERFVLTQQAEQLMLDEAGVLPVFFQGSASAAHDYVENYKVSTLGSGWQLNYLHVNK